MTALYLLMTALYHPATVPDPPVTPPPSILLHLRSSVFLHFHWEIPLGSRELSSALGNGEGSDNQWNFYSDFDMYRI